MSEKKFADLAEQVIDQAGVVSRDIRIGIRGALSYLDRHPEEVPSPTITESELELAVAEVFGSDWRADEPCRVLVEHLGIEVVPDPAPTNVERLEKLLEQSSQFIDGSAGALALCLDHCGVTAPEGDDDEQ